MTQTCCKLKAQLASLQGLLFIKPSLGGSMPNRAKHLAIGGVASALCELLYQYSQSKSANILDFFSKELDLGNVLAASAGGLIGSLAPDLLEPAYNPNHRQFFHSWATFGGVGAAGSYLTGNTPQAAFARGGVVGYASHLLADARTPKGLPLIGKIG
jgi:membrane-bound metal-dependent hydrolase YbcI (DUF457 family)